MKKFQKILGAGLVLAQACSSSLVLGVDSMPRYNSPDLDHVPHGIQVILDNPHRASKKFSIATMFFKLLRLGFTADVIQQLLCANCPGIQVALAGYADTSSFKFSECMKPYASLAHLGESIDMGFLATDYFDDELICREITGGFANAAKIAVLGFAKDIYVMHTDSNQFKFYYMPGNYGLTSVDACKHLQHLIDKVTAIKACDRSDPEPVKLADDLLQSLRDRAEFLSRCVPYKLWIKASEAATTAATSVATAINTFTRTLGIDTAFWPAPPQSYDHKHPTPSADAPRPPTCGSSAPNAHDLRNTLHFPEPSDGSASAPGSYAALAWPAWNPTLTYPSAGFARSLSRANH